MTYAPRTISDAFDTVPRMPAWVTSRRPETSEDVAFLSGAALAHLHLVVKLEQVPQSLLRAHLALRAAEQCVMNAGRPERAGDLRDALGFLQAGDSPGPAGEVYLSWRRTIERPVSVKALHRALPHIAPEDIATWLDAGQGHPVSRAAGVLDCVLQDLPRDPAAALIVADAALAQALGWTHVMPLYAMALKASDLRVSGDGLRVACHRAVVTAAKEVARAAADLSRRSAHLQAVAPKLRAKGAEEALALFLRQDAVAPAALVSLRSPRAARRFCDRLVELGAVRELTGRDSFRLYGV